MTQPARVSPSPDSPLGKLLAAPMRSGTVVWIGVRPKRHQALLKVASAVFVAERGIEGDHYETHRNGRRQVTLIARESLAAIASFVGLEDIAPERLRRNIVTAGLNLNALKGRHFRVGDAVLEATGDCAPCSRMEDELGAGGYNAVRGHGGITARIVTGGAVKIGAAIVMIDG